jgi:hypothetical protein
VTYVRNGAKTTLTAVSVPISIISLRSARSSSSAISEKVTSVKYGPYQHQQEQPWVQHEHHCELRMT